MPFSVEGEEEAYKKAEELGLTCYVYAGHMFVMAGPERFETSLVGIVASGPQRLVVRRRQKSVTCGERWRSWQLAVPAVRQ